MADSQRFAVAVHTLMILAAHKAGEAGHPMTSAEMAKSVNANPVVLRRVISSLAQAGLVATRPGAHGGVWLAKAPNDIAMDQVRGAVDEGPLVCARTKINSDCPVAVAALDVIDSVSKRVDGAVRDSLALLTLADLVKQLPDSLTQACAATPPASPTLAA
ncbi:MAG: Rrf2 family transcriptional regulator [Alphaproteobacteria bacterium]|nr:Rrf2 family transcriptional regulator [Alphaproteobacteria bacterium]